MHNQYNHTSNCIFSSFYVGFVITIRPAWLRILACARPSQLAVWATSTARGRVAMLVRCFGTRGFQFWQLMDPSNDRQLHYDLVIIEFIMYSSFSVVSFNVIRTHWAGFVALRAPVGTTKVLRCHLCLAGVRRAAQLSLLVMIFAEPRAWRRARRPSCEWFAPRFRARR